ncbi:MAG: hypothetical protein ACRC0M_10545, partial [Legionella sp.]
MLLTLAIVVFFASIFVFFSQEFIKTGKKIFSIKGAPLILPLAIASWLLYQFSSWILWGLYYYGEVLIKLRKMLIMVIPFQQLGYPLATIIVLTVISVLPVVLLDIYLKHKTYKGYKYPYTTSSIIWIISVV